MACRVRYLFPEQRDGSAVPLTLDLSCPRGRRRSSLRAAYTLVEMMVVVAVILVLLSLLMPSLRNAIECARTTQCQNHLHQLSVCTVLYHQDNFDYYPRVYTLGSNPQPWYWYHQLQAYLDPDPAKFLPSSHHPDFETFRCPSNPMKSKRHFAANKAFSNPDNAYRVAEILYPSQRLWLGENNDANSAYIDGRSIADHHLGANFLFLDQHLEFMPLGHIFFNGEVNPGGLILFTATPPSW